MVEEGGVFRFRAEVAVVGVEEGVEAEDGGEVKLGPGKDAEGGPGSGAQARAPGEEKGGGDDATVGEVEALADLS